MIISTHRSSHLKRLIRNILATIGAAVLCIGGDACQSSNPQPTHQKAFSNDGLVRARAEDLRSTLVTPHMNAPIRPQQNVVWCASFQLAWNEACNLAGGHLQVLGETPQTVTELNRKSFSSSDLDSAAYVAMAGYVRDGVLDQIPKQLAQKFQGQADPHLLPKSRADMRPQDLIAYAYLFKHLEFPVPYERGEYPVPFENASIECFGMGTDYKPGRHPMAAQTLIHSYQDEDNFVIELKTKSQDEHLILAKVTPQATLAQTVAAVQARLIQTPTPAAPADVLIVPRANFDITRSYKELVGLRLRPTAPGMADDLTLRTALQNIRFQLDEKGVRLKSESQMHFGCSANPRPRPTHTMIFDKPFLLTLTRAGATSPYLAMWIATPELLTRAR